MIVGERATIDLAATIMGDVRIGPDATILAHSVLIPGSRVGNGEVWGGVPARRINREEMEVLKKEMGAQVDSNKNASETQKRVQKNQVFLLLPIISYLFVLYAKVMPYLSILDHSYTLWSKHSISANSP